ncbi:hypothetical protein GQ600_25912 [Phytophthora cactorum]|nr:hypothetical protein GQ600_25912 [Phytophthora cactorum]
MSTTVTQRCEQAGVLDCAKQLCAADTASVRPDRISRKMIFEEKRISHRPETEISPEDDPFSGRRVVQQASSPVSKPSQASPPISP